MLDMSNPRAADIFAASRQMDLILEFCKVLTLGRTAARRQFTLRIMQPAFAALRWLNAEHFARSPAIEFAIAELQAGAAAIANMEMGDPPPGADQPPKTCPACGTPLMQPTQYSPTPYCSKCLDLIMPGLLKLRHSEGGFGTEAI